MFQANIIMFAMYFLIIILNVVFYSLSWNMITGWFPQIQCKYRLDMTVN